MLRQEKNICIFGSTGSIGNNTLHVVENLQRNGRHLNVRYLTAGKNYRKLAQQVEAFSPEAVVIEDTNAYQDFKNEFRFEGLEVMCGRQELLNLSSNGDYELAVSSLSGLSGLSPTLSALKSGKNVALANKETLVSAGHLVKELQSSENVMLYPIDSEHSAILQCILGEESRNVDKVVLTASGGPFLNWSVKDIKNSKVSDALKHPNWQMGRKITIDSATMMNKGLEVIEAKWLYSLTTEQIQVIIHPQSIVHSFVEFSDGSVKAQLGVPDMRIPIQFALTYPERVSSDFPRMDFSTLSALEFQQPDTEKFRCLALAYEAAESGQSYPAVLNSANEAAVELFLNGKISFIDIVTIVQESLENHNPVNLKTAEEIVELDRQIRNEIMKPELTGQS